MAAGAPAPAAVVLDIVPLVPELPGCPEGLLVASYGGGDDMCVARPILHLRARPPRVPARLRAEIVAAVDEALQLHASASEDTRVATLPARSPWASVAAGCDLIQWSSAVEISSRVYGTEEWDTKCNLFAHGWLFRDVVREPGRDGAGRWPLIGVFHADGFAEHLDETYLGSDASAGLNKLRPADQHVHVVDAPEVPDLDGLDLDRLTPAELEALFAAREGGAGPRAWHLGSDAARVDFAVDQPASCGIVVAVDLHDPARPRALVTFLVIVNGDLEGVVDAKVNSAAPAEPWTPARVAALFDDTDAAPLIARNRAWMDALLS